MPLDELGRWIALFKIEEEERKQAERREQMKSKLRARTSSMRK